MVTNGPMLYVGIVLVLCGLLFLYFRRKVNSLEYKVNTLFTLVQDHIDKQKQQQEQGEISIYPTESQNGNMGFYEDGNVEQLIPVSQDELSSEEELSEEETEEEELSEEETEEESQSEQVKTINIGGSSGNQEEFQISLDNLESVELSLKDSISTQNILKELMEQTEDIVEKNNGTQGGNGSIEELNLEELTEELTEEETEEEELSEEEGQEGGVIEVTKTDGGESVEETSNVKNSETKSVEIDLSTTSELELTKLTVPRLRELILTKDPNANVKKLKKNALIALLQSE